MINKLYIILFLSAVFPGTLYFSQSNSDASEYIMYDLAESSTDIKIEETFSIGYHHNVWKKRRVRYGAELGFEIFANDDVKFLAIYSMGTYRLNNKKFHLYATLGLDFYDHEYSQINPNQNNPNFNDEFIPNTKGGYVYGVGFSYLITKHIPIAFDYKVLEAQEVHSSVWKKIHYGRAAIQLGYKF